MSVLTNNDIEGNSHISKDFNLPSFIVINGGLDSSEVMSFWNDHEEMEKVLKLIEQWRNQRINKPTVLSTFIRHLKFYIPSIRLLTIFSGLFNSLSFIQILLVTGSVLLSHYLDIQVNIQSTLFVTPLVFPLTFLVNRGYQRRESVLEHLSLFKSNLSSVFVFLNEWLVSKFPELEDKLIKVLLCISNEMRKFLEVNDITEQNKHREEIGNLIGKIVAFIEIMRNDPTDPLRHFVQSSITARQVFFTNASIEQLVSIKQNSPPKILRAFERTLIFLLPIILGPFYVLLQRSSGIFTVWQMLYVAYLTTFIFSVIQNCLDLLFEPFKDILIDNINLRDMECWTQNTISAIISKHKNLIDLNI